jgi:hypothetical protein
MTDIAAVIADPDRPFVFVVKNEVLTNQLRRDALKIGSSFDALCDSDLQELSKCFAASMSVTMAGLMWATKREQKLEMACAELLLNASHSFTAAVLLLRSGFYLQPGILIRSLLESFSTVFHLVQTPDDIERYRTGNLPSTKTIAAAKRALPVFGQLYGYFSDNFAHIGQLHRGMNPLTEFKVRGDELVANLGFLRLAVWLLYVTAEFAFNEVVPDPRYWKPVTDGFEYAPSDAEREWMNVFLNDWDKT